MRTPVDVSVVIPCFNGRWIIPRLAENLNTLRTGTIEVVFVDDGSTDGSLSLFKEQIPWGVCLRQEKKGLAAARNTGARAARGEFIQFLDADDTLNSGKLDAQVELSRRGRFDVVYSDWRMVIVSEDGEKPEPVERAEAPTEIIEALLGGWWCPPHAYIVRREAYLGCGGSDETLVNAQDFELWMRLAVTGEKFGYLPGCFANYYRYTQRTSLARGDRRQYWSDYEKAILKIVRMLEDRCELNAPRRRAAARRLHDVARNVYRIDASWFDRLLVEIYSLDPDFAPVGSWLYKTSAQIFGLKRAERLALWKRS